MHGASDEAISLQPTQSEGQHALRDTADCAADLVEPHGTVLTTQQLDDQHRPLVPYAGERLANELALAGVVLGGGVILSRHRGGLIYMPRFQISAFLRTAPIVTILALVTKSNQAT